MRWKRERPWLREGQRSGIDKLEKSRPRRKVRLAVQWCSCGRGPPGIPRNSCARFVHDNAFGHWSGIDPQHLHRSVGFVDKVVDSSAWLQCRLTVAHRVPSPFNDAGRGSRDNADRLIEIVNVRGESPPGMKQSISPAHFDSGNQRRVKAIDEFGIRTGDDTGGRGIAIDSFCPRHSGRSLGHRAA